MRDPLAILATTQNYNSSDKNASSRVIQIYQKLKMDKMLPDYEVEMLLREALKLKKTPEKEIESLLSPPITLFCFPYAGGSSSLYENWGAQLPRSIKVIGMEYPGRGSKGKEAFIKTLDSLLSHFEIEVLSKIKGPFAFFGHSLGAIVAFELACLLQEKQRLNPISLFLSGCPAPDKIVSLSSLSQMEDKEFIQALESLKGTPQELLGTVEFKEMFLPILRADFSLLDTYIPGQKRIKCPLVILGGKQDFTVDIQDLPQWAFWTESNISLVELEGDHFFIRKQKPVLNVIAENL